MHEFVLPPGESLVERWRWARREQAGLDPEADHERLVHLCFELLVAAMDDHLRSTHDLPRPATGAHAVAAGGARVFMAAKRVLPDPSDRSWADHFPASGRGDPAARPAGSVGPPAAAAGAALRGRRRTRAQS